MRSCTDLQIIAIIFWVVLGIFTACMVGTILWAVYGQGLNPFLFLSVPPGFVTLIFGSIWLRYNLDSHPTRHVETPLEPVLDN